MKLNNYFNNSKNKLYIMKSVIMAIGMAVLLLSCAKDKEKPTITISSPTEGSSMMANATGTFNFSCKDNKELHDVKFEVRNSSNSAILVEGDEHEHQKEFSKSISFTTPNDVVSLKFKVEASDHAGNKMEKEISIQVIK
jgi:hypothetical protein